VTECQEAAWPPLSERDGMTVHSCIDSCQCIVAVTVRLAVVRIENPWAQIDKTHQILPGDDTFCEDGY
jgi:hypothetical protein